MTQLLASNLCNSSPNFEIFEISPAVEDRLSNCKIGPVDMLVEEFGDHNGLSCSRSRYLASFAFNQPEHTAPSHLRWVLCEVRMLHECYCEQAKSIQREMQRAFCQYLSGGCLKLEVHTLILMSVYNSLFISTRTSLWPGTTAHGSSRSVSQT